MSDNEHLYLHEEVALLALNDEKGTLDYPVGLSSVLAGAILSELFLAERIKIVGKTTKTVTVKDKSPMDHGIIDACLAMIADSEKLRNIKHWVDKIAWKPELWNDITQKLCDRGILRKEKGKVLFIFSRTIYPEQNSRPERKLVERLKKAIFRDSLKVDERTMILIALLHKSELLYVPFSRKEIRDRKRHIERIIKGDLIADATASAIEAAQAAVLVTILMPVIITTVVS